MCVYGCVCAHVCIHDYLHMSTGLLRGQYRALDPLEVEFQVAVSYPVWVLGVIHYSSRGAQVLFYLYVLNGR